jgi:hypothetical protein
MFWLPILYLEKLYISKSKKICNMNLIRKKNYRLNWKDKKANKKESLLSLKLLFNSKMNLKIYKPQRKKKKRYYWTRIPFCNHKKLEYTCTSFWILTSRILAQFLILFLLACDCLYCLFLLFLVYEIFALSKDYKIIVVYKFKLFYRLLRTF